MLNRSAVCAFSLVVVGLVTSFASAGIVNITCADDGDGVITCGLTAWSENWYLVDPQVPQQAYQLSILGAQHRVAGQGDAGHILGDFITDTELDPLVKIQNSIDNDMDFTWTGYQINITMSKLFSISNAAVDAPGDWTTMVFQPYPIGGAPYLGTILYIAGSGVPVGPYVPGTGVPVGGTLDFHYWLSFLGSASYTQEMIPTPEPMTLSMLAVGGLAMLRRRSR